jgi:hypothetical protein
MVTVPAFTPVTSPSQEYRQALGAMRIAGNSNAMGLEDFHVTWVVRSCTGSQKRFLLPCIDTVITLCAIIAFTLTDVFIPDIMYRKYKLL